MSIQQKCHNCCVFLSHFHQKREIMLFCDKIKFLVTSYQNNFSQSHWNSCCCLKKTIVKDLIQHPSLSCKSFNIIHSREKYIWRHLPSQNSSHCENWGKEYRHVYLSMHTRMYVYIHAAWNLLFTHFVRFFKVNCFCNQCKEPLR